MLGIIYAKEQLKIIVMKGSRNEANKQSKQEKGNKPIPEIRDNMDARHNKESNKNNPGISQKRGNKEPKK
jgi:hypothetical protein